MQRAAADLRERLLETAADAWGIERAELEVADGVVRGAGREAGYAELIAERFGFVGGELVGEGEVRPERGSGSYAEGPVFWEIRIAAAEVGVDPETGRVGVERMATIADVGKAINPLLVERQDEGAVLQGVGNALFEEMVFEDGVLMNDTLLDYRVPRIEDMPAQMTGIIVENADGPGPYGAKGCGEGAQAATPAAIATALADAGVPMYELPFTPERVWRRIQAIKEKRMSEISRAAMIGTGTMGPGMGAVLERAGIQVALYDVSEEAIERAKQGVELARGVLERLEVERVDGGDIRFETDLAAALEGAELVLEAVPEKLELKQQVFADFERHVADDAILSSNTSGIPITKIAEGLEHPERVVGMHWSNPPHLIPMIEVIPGERTSEETVAAAKGLIERLGYRASMLNKEVPGFVENRVLYAIMRECLALVDEG